MKKRINMYLLLFFLSTFVAINTVSIIYQYFSLSEKSALVERTCKEYTGFYDPDFIYNQHYSDRNLIEKFNFNYLCAPGMKPVSDFENNFWIVSNCLNIISITLIIIIIILILIRFIKYSFHK